MRGVILALLLSIPLDAAIAFGIWYAVTDHHHPPKCTSAISEIATTPDGLHTTHPYVVWFPKGCAHD